MLPLLILEACMICGSSINGSEWMLREYKHKPVHTVSKVISDVTNPRIPYKQDKEHSFRIFSFIIVFKILENIYGGFNWINRSLYFD